MEIWETKLPGILWATPGLLRDCFSFYWNLIGRFLNENFSADLSTLTQPKEGQKLWE